MAINYDFLWVDDVLIFIDELDKLPRKENDNDNETDNINILVQ